jgi:Flp pilus assembly protein protease CpaA
VRAFGLMPYTATHFLILGVLCGAASLWDLAQRRVPNVLVASLLAAGLWAQATTAGPLGALGGLGAGVLVLLALYPLWRRGGIGGGDVKLALAAGTWVGFSRLPVFLLAGALGGGVISAICYLHSRGEARSAIRNNLWMTVALRQLPDATTTRAGIGRVSVPYALAISGAIFAALLLKLPALF